jgi:SAM-dependent methyltransferase
MIENCIGKSGRVLQGLDELLMKGAKQCLHQIGVWAYLGSDRRPWRFGYEDYRTLYLEKVIKNSGLLETFRTSKPLPAGHGFRLDARAVEIPWVLARVAQGRGRLLDAGSSLNRDFVLEAPSLSSKKITIVTLAPEAVCYWKLGISYIFGDLRSLDFRDEWFDMIVCISTIEHVGMDNSMYTGRKESLSASSTEEFLIAVKELRRVLKREGILYITFPFGQYEDHGWFQQFDSQLTDNLIEEFRPSNLNETVFRYDPDGWKLSERASCIHAEYFDVQRSKYFDPNSSVEYPPDFPAGERAVMCLELCK